jgi:uncharacterized protein (TIGR02145 family)
VSVPYALHAGSAEKAKSADEATTLRDSSGNVYQIKTVNGQPTLVAAPGSASNPGSFACGQSVTYDGESYPTVQIGTQCWFQKNLNVGTMILGANDQTNNSILEKYCYNNLQANCDTFGGLYQWGEAVQYQNGASNVSSSNPIISGNIKGVCPSGWHLPTFSEISTMLYFASDSNCISINSNGTSCSGVANKIKSTNFWKNPNNYPITNSTGFSALPAKERNENPLFFSGSNSREYTIFLTSNEVTENVFSAIVMSLHYGDENIRFSQRGKFTGLSVRCLKD